MTITFLPGIESSAFCISFQYLPSLSQPSPPRQAVELFSSHSLHDPLLTNKTADECNTCLWYELTDCTEIHSSGSVKESRH